jgi:alcohol dehydrogenase (cytochrome c)
MLCRLGSLIGAAILVLTSYTVSAQTADELKVDAQTTGNVLTLGMGHGQQRFSPLTQIDKSSVKRLVPVWSYSLADNRGQESQPLIYNGVMYVTTHDATHAIDVATGRQVWKHVIEYPPETPRVACCGIVNRGAAIYEGMLYRTTLDAHVLALKLATGEEIWRSKAAEFSEGYSMTVAPLVANGVLITGISGGEYGTRGFLDGWDPATGKKLWRRYTVAGPGEPGADTWPGDTWKHGGAPTWLTGSYDPELDLVYWGTGNGGPWNAEFRKGDNLYINSVLAIRPKTGEMVWYYQFSPNDPYDYDGVNENVIADMRIEGEVRKVILHADRNGFFYVIDRTDGELIAANAFVDHINWAEGIDMKTGRPIESALTKHMRKTGEIIEVWPSAFGGKNWMPMSFSPRTGLAYANTLNIGFTYKVVEPKYTKGAFYFGIDLSKTKWMLKPGEQQGYLRAIDPLTGKSKWSVGSDLPSFSGTIVTAGGLVFTGATTGEFMAFDADSGEKLWQFQTGSGIIGQPITWQAGGRQFVSVASGWGAVYSIFMPAFGSHNKETIAALSKIQTGGSIWTFALPGE